jgi:hypothetical protein
MLAAGTVGLADTPTTAPTTAPAALKAAFDKLAADDASEREAALEQIVQMGDSIAEPLKALIAATSDIEQRTSAEAALTRIHENASIGPTLITLKLDKVPASRAIDELAKKSGYPIRTNKYGGDDRKVSVDVTNQNFWSVFRDICQQGNYTIQNNGNNQLSVSQGGSSTGPIYIDGPFMIMARSINLSSSVQLQMRGAGNKNVSVQFSCFVEPKLQITQRPYYVQLTECTDDKGRSLVLNQPGMFDNFAEGGNQTMWEANAQLKIPENDASRIASMKGSVRVIAATKTETMEFDDIGSAKNVTKTAGGYSLTVKNSSINNDQVTVNMTLVFPPRRNAYQLLQQIKLLDTQGNPMQLMDTTGPNGVGPNRMDYRVTYQRRGDDDNSKPGKPAKLVMAVPTETKPLEFNFEFKDLPLPH